MKILSCILVFACLLPTVAATQTSVGFEYTKDIEDLLDYRLPDWGWRTWDLKGEFRGAGSNRSYDDNFSSKRTSSHRSNNAYLSSFCRLYQESEKRTLYANVHLNGTWSRYRSESYSSADSRWEFGGNCSLGGQADQYLGSSPWSMTAGFQATGGYLEQHSQYGDDDEHLNIVSGHQHSANLGLGLGRIRDVTPLIRAKRLSERLAALGRPRLTSSEVHHVAQVLAQQYGYRMVFDRPDRRFWRDVLEPLLEGEPLSVAEIFYLTDVLDEDLGVRRQGSMIRLAANWQQRGIGDNSNYQPGALMSAEMVKNLSLSLQLRGFLEGTWLKETVASVQRERAKANLGGDLLWNMADRLRLDIDLYGSMSRFDYADHTRSSHEETASVESHATLNIYLEDRLVLQPYTSLGWEEYRNDGEYGSYSHDWHWTYGITFNYRLDGTLF